MPEISRFLGIVISMFYRDHHPPHFHATYGEHEVTVKIESGEVTGEFPRRALKLVHEWLDIHRPELETNWELARRREALNRIEPLE